MNARHREARTGPGRWCTVLTPCPGILWTDGEVIGFEPIRSDEVDPGPVDDQIAAYEAAGLPGAVAFDLLSKLIGRNIVRGELSTWTPERNRPRPDLGAAPVMTTTEVMQAIE